MQFGDFQVDMLSDGRIWLDGGAMFGVVPRILWQKVTKPDEKNRVPLGLNCILVRTGSKNVLIDTGCGSKYSEKQIQIYGIEHLTDLYTELDKIRVHPSDIDVVINTHLHFDHCGGNTRVEDGHPVPSFPNATYIVNAREYEDANSANERTKASYFQQNWAPLEERGQLELVSGDREIAAGVTVIHTPGHTQGHQSVRISSQGSTLFYFGDLCPTAAHVPLPWIMGYDLFPLTTLETKKRIYHSAVAEHWLVVFEHDPTHAAGYLSEDDGTYSVEPADWNT